VIIVSFGLSFRHNGLHSGTLISQYAKG
jgi:hypothetical protein